MTRRQFIAGAASAPLSAFAPRAFSASRTDQPDVRVTRQVLTVSYGDAQWCVDSARFGRRSKVYAKGLGAGKGFALGLSDASCTGTNLSVDFNALIENVDGVWRINVRFRRPQSPEIKLRQDWPELTDWLSGKHEIVAKALFELRVGGRAILPVGAKHFAIGIDKDLRPRVDGQIRVNLPRATLTASGARFSASAKGSVLLNALGLPAGEAATTVVTFNAPVSSPVVLMRSSVGGTLRWEPDTQIVRLEAFRGTAADDALFVAEGAAVLSSFNGADITTRTRIRLERACLSGFLSTFAEEVLLGFLVARKAFGFDTRSMSFRVQGSDELHVERLRLSSPRNVLVSVRLLRAYLPVQGASAATIEFPAVMFDILIGNLRAPGVSTAGAVIDAAITQEMSRTDDPTPLNPPHERAFTCSARLDLGIEARFTASLEQAELRLERSADLFDLRFRFRHYRLECSRDLTSLIPPCANERGCAVPGVKPRLIVIFPPQHLQEEVFHHREDPAESCPSGAGAASGANVASGASAASGTIAGAMRPRAAASSKASAASGAPGTMPSRVAAGNSCSGQPQSGEDSRKVRDVSEHDTCPYELARTLAAGPTRLVFEPDDGEIWTPQELTVDSLTEWRDLGLVVHKRALPRSAALDEQLSSVRIDTTTNRDEARHRLYEALSAGPSPDQTALETVTGLILSPDRSARFDTPRHLAAGQTPPVWSARLRLAADSAVRAIYARGLDPSFLTPRQPTDHNFERFTGSLDASDRRQLVVLMSAYGLAALRRLQLKPDGAGQIGDDPKGMVVRPENAYAYLSRFFLPYTVGAAKVRVEVPQEGLLMPRPFEAFSLLLSPYGATMNARWEGEPPAPIDPKEDPFFAAALDIESYVHRTVYGRDAFVQVAYKGFLFPLGHRAALIKLTERQMRPLRDNAEGLYPTAYLIRRDFIVCQKPKKGFPALGQPFDSREFPVSAVELLTKTTPDIINLVEYQSQVIDLSPWAGESMADRTTRLRMGAHPRPRDADTKMSDDVPAYPAPPGMVFWPRSRCGNAPAPGPLAPDGGTPTVADPNLYGNELLFEYTVDGSAQPVRSPLIFVDNTAAHDPVTMQALVAYYEQLPHQLPGASPPAPAPLQRAAEPASAPAAPPAQSVVNDGIQTLRIARHGLAKRTYAPPGKPGDTSFMTAFWLLGASGGLGASQVPALPGPPADNSGGTGFQASIEQQYKVLRGKLASLFGASTGGSSGAGASDAAASGQPVFTMDGLMEGADQPPFYPRVARAYINMQPLDRLLGRPQGLIETGFDELYVRHAFAAAGNPSEIYLSVIAPAIDLNVSAQGDACGGVAKPNARFAAMSRKIGMVGGRPISRSSSPGAPAVGTLARPNRAALPAPAAEPAATPLPAGVGSDQRSYDISAASTGRFDPIEFFGGALFQANFLGILSLGDVVKAVLIAEAPKLTEVTSYAMDLLEVVLRDAAKLLGASAQTIRATANDQIARALNLKQPPEAAAVLYPQLTARLHGLEDIAANIAALDETAFQADAPSWANRLYGAGRALLDSMEDVAAHPAPVVLSALINEIEGARRAIEAALSAGAVNKQPIAVTIGDATASALTAFLTKLSQVTLATAVAPKAAPDSAPSVTLFDAVFGGHEDNAEGYAAAIQRFIDHPDSAFPDLQSAIYGELVGQPIIVAWGAFKALLDEVEWRLSWSRDQAAAAVLDALSLGSRELEDALRVAAFNLVDSVQKQLAAGFIDPTGRFDTLSRQLGQLPQAVFDAAARETETRLQAFRQAVTAQQGPAAASRDKEFKTATDPTKPLAKRALAESAMIQLDGRLVLYARQLKAIEVALGKLKQDGGQDLMKRVRDSVEHFFEATISAFIAAQQQRAQDTADALMTRTLTGLTSLIPAVETSALFLRAAQLSSVLKDWCADAGSIVQSLGDWWAAPFDQIESDVTGWQQVLTVVRIKENVADALRNELGAAIAALNQGASNLIGAVEQLKAVRKEMQSHVADACNKPAVITQAMVDLLAQRSRVFELLRKFALDSARLTQASSGQDVFFVLDPSQQQKVADTLPQLGKHTSDAAVKAVSQFAPPAKLMSVISQLQGANADLAAMLNATIAETGQAMQTVSDAFARDIDRGFEALVHLPQQERRLAAQLCAAFGMTAPTQQALLKDVGNLLTPLALLGSVCGTVKDELDRVDDLLTCKNKGKDTNKDIDPCQVIATLGAPGIAEIERASALLDQDITLLKQVNDAVNVPSGQTVSASALAGAVSNLRTNWAQRGPGIVQAIAVLRRELDLLVHGQLGAFFDLSALRSALEAALQELVPTSVTLTYAWDAALEPFPADDPIFYIAGAGETDLGKEALPLINDLVLTTSVHIDLHDNTHTGATRTVATTGRLRPFHIHLLGDAFDLLTIKFKGAAFTAGTNSAAHFTADVDGVEIGEKLSFLDALSAFFSPPAGNGLYVTPHLFPPEIEAGYQFQSDVVELGELLLLNIAIRVAVHLPFDNRQASFTFAFASHEKPFLIVCMPYGGGGSVALLASAKGVIGFDVAFEFGGVAAIKFGPLEAQGRISAGIHFLSDTDHQELEGFVNAVGEGNIACFGVSVNVCVCIRQADGGSMEGSSTYSFAFRVGMFSIHYSFTATYQVSGGSKKDGADKKGAAPMLLGSGHEPALSGAALMALRAHAPRTPPREHISVSVPEKWQHWGSYRQYVNI